MNKLYAIIALSAAIFTNAVFGKTADCFNSYHLRVVNQSGGEAILKSSKDISGFRKGLKNSIKNYGSKDIIVENAGASLTIEHGSEDKEKVDTVHFFEKTGSFPTLELKGSSIKAQGFNTQQGAQYNVEIRNESGGKAKVIDTCQTCFHGDIENKASHTAKVRPGSTMTMLIGPKGNKKEYKLKFGTPTVGGKPTITLRQGGWFSPAISGTDLRLGVSRISNQNTPVAIMNKKETPKVQHGACGKNKKADLHG